MSLLASSRNAVAWFRDPYGFLDRHIARAEYDFRVDLPGAKRAMFVGSPDLIDEVVRNEDLVGGRGLRFVQPFTGPRALIVLSGDEHRKRRRPVRKLFQLADDRWMIERTEHYFDQAARSLRPGEPFSLVEFYEGITLHTIIDHVLGVDADQHQQIFGLLTGWMRSIRSPAWLFLKPLQRDLGAFSPWGRFLRAREAIRGWIRNLLRDPACESRSVLARLIAERDSSGLGIDDEDLIWQCIELLLFGHDTTACGSAWVIMHLLDRSLLDTRELAAPRYREACILESLRYTPMVIHVTREAIADTRVGDETIRAGQKVFPCAYLAQRNHHVYADPAVFDPERFLDGLPPLRGAWFPFGLGGRTCAGMPFALGQMAVLLRRTLEFGKPGKVLPGPTGASRKFIIMAPASGGLVRYDVVN